MLPSKQIRLWIRKFLLQGAYYRGVWKRIRMMILSPMPIKAAGRTALVLYRFGKKNRVSEVKINKLHGMMAGYAVGQLLNTDSQIRLDGYLKMNGWEYDYMSGRHSDTHQGRSVG